MGRSITLRTPPITPLLRTPPRGMGTPAITAHNPWTSNFRIVVRNGQLLLVAPTGDEEALTPLAEHVFAIGDPAQSPARLRFEQV